jgi:hypothetical protein
MCLIKMNKDQVESPKVFRKTSSSLQTSINFTKSTHQLLQGGWISWNVSQIQSYGYLNTLRMQKLTFGKKRKPVELIHKG